MAQQRSLYEAEAHAACLRGSGSATATEHALAEAEAALGAAGLGDLEHSLAKARELHRLCSARIAAVVRRLGDGEVGHG